MNKNESDYQLGRGMMSIQYLWVFQMCLFGLVGLWTVEGCLAGEINVYKSDFLL